MKHLTVVFLESTVSEQSLLYITLQFENLKGACFQTPADSIASNQITSVALCIQWREDSIFLGIVLSIPESLHPQGETYHNSRKFGSVSHWPSFFICLTSWEEETNVSNKGCWFSKLSFQMYHVADIYLINPIVCVYIFISATTDSWNLAPQHPLSRARVFGVCRCSWLVPASP